MFTNTQPVPCATPASPRPKKPCFAWFTRASFSGRKRRIVRYCNKYAHQSYLFPSLYNWEINRRNYWPGVRSLPPESGEMVTHTVVVIMLLGVQICQSPVNLPLSFLSVTEAVISRKLKGHPRGGAGKLPRPENVKSLLRGSRTPPRATTEERESTLKEAAHPCCACGCCFLLSCTCLCFTLLLNMCVKIKLVWAAVEICARDTEYFTRERDLRACRCVFARVTFDTNITP